MIEHFVFIYSPDFNLNLVFSIKVNLSLGEVLSKLSTSPSYNNFNDKSGIWVL